MSATRTAVHNVLPVVINCNHHGHGDVTVRPFGVRTVSNDHVEFECTRMGHLNFASAPLTEELAQRLLAAGVRIPQQVSATRK